MTCVITICETCKRADWDAEKTSQPDGERLAELVEKAAQSVDSISVRRHSCLMGCDFACNVAIQSSGKLDYVLGTFEPTEESAQGIVDYAALYADSKTGQVPYKTWPQAIKGHFRARLPKLESGE